MSAPLLTTKLYIPHTPVDLVSRPRLIERLHAGLHRKLTLVSAPAGFGKTTLVSAWVEACDHPVAWLSLDEGDNDPAYVWRYLVAALQTVREDVGQVAAAFQSPALASLRSALTSLINLLAQAPDPFILVLDDYHVIQTPAVHEALTFLLDHQPPQMHLVIATRADPPLPLARLRGRGQLAEFYEADLRFTVEEAAAFLQQTMGLRLSAEDVAALEHRTEGWIAGLQMAAVSMQRQDDPTGFVRAFTGSHRYIFDYLGDEVLRRQPPHVRRFLLRTAILDRLTASLCDALCEEAADEVLDQTRSPAFETSATPPSAMAPPPVTADSAAMLAYLERHNLFVVSLDYERRWYRYHRLFADLLRQHLQRETPDLIPELHGRASVWYEQAATKSKGDVRLQGGGMALSAVEHALRARDDRRVADLIEALGWEMLTLGETVTLMRWIDALPEARLHVRPSLCLFYGWGLALTGQLEAVEPYLQDFDMAEHSGQVAALRSYVAGQRDELARALEFSDQASAHLPEDHLFLRCLVAMNRGTALLNLGRPQVAADALREAIRLSESVALDYFTLILTSLLGQVYEMQGQLQHAFDRHQEALATATRESAQPAPFAGVAYMGMAEIFYEWNNLGDARRCALEGIRLSEVGDIVDTLLAGHLILGDVSLARGDLERARIALTDTDRLAARHAHSYVTALIDNLRTRLWMAQGDAPRAFQWARASLRDLGEDDNFTREAARLVVARVLLVEAAGASPASSRALTEATRLLTQVLDHAGAAGRGHHVIKASALQAVALHLRGDDDQALSSLARALALAEPAGYVRTFVDEGAPMSWLLRQALLRDIEPTYASCLLAAMDEAASIPANAALVEPLTDREIDVLRLIMAGLSNQEIADTLFIAVSTVKSHVNHLYGKLGVENRTQAVLKAQELALL